MKLPLWLNVTTTIKSKDCNTRCMGPASASMYCTSPQLGSCYTLESAKPTCPILRHINSVSIPYRSALFLLVIFWVHLYEGVSRHVNPCQGSYLSKGAEPGFNSPAKKGREKIINIAYTLGTYIPHKYIMQHFVIVIT